jgi:hypothetical protein
MRNIKITVEKILMEKPEDDEIKAIESYEKIKRSGKLQLNEI